LAQVKDYLASPMLSASIVSKLSVLIEDATQSVWTFAVSDLVIVLFVFMYHLSDYLFKKL